MNLTDNWRPPPGVQPPDEGLDRSPIWRGSTVDHSMTPEVARVYRQALTYGLDEMRVPYAAAVTFASWHRHVGQILHDDDLDASWEDWTSRPEAAGVLDDDGSN